MKRLLFFVSAIFFIQLGYGQSSTLFPVPANEDHAGAIMRHEDGTLQVETFFKLEHENKVWSIKTMKEIDPNSFLLIGKFANRSAYSLIHFDLPSQVFREVHTFDSSALINFSEELYLGQNGQIIGVTIQGLNQDTAHVFSYSPSTEQVQILGNLNSTTFRGIATSFAFDAAKNLLYGTCLKSSTDYLGIIFSLQLSTFQVSELFQMGSISASGLSGKHWQYSDQFGVLGYLQTSGGKSYLFRLKDKNFTLIRDFHGFTERPVGSVCVLNNRIIGTSVDVVKELLQVFSLDSNGNDRKSILVSRDTAWGSSYYRSLIPLNTTTVLYCAFNGGQYNTGGLMEIEVPSFKITPKLSFSASLGHAPARMLYNKAQNKLTIQMTSGGSAGKGTLLHYDLTNTSIESTQLYGTPYGAIISNKVIEMGNKKIVYLAEKGGVYGKGALGIFDFVAQKLDTVISLGSDTVFYDSSYRYPDIRSLAAINDSLLAFHFTEGGRPRLNGGTVIFSLVSMSPIRQLSYTRYWEQIPFGPINLINDSSIYIWTENHNGGNRSNDLIAISVYKDTSYTVFSERNPYGTYGVYAKYITEFDGRLYIPFRGKPSSFGIDPSSDGIAQLESTTAIKYTAFPYIQYGMDISSNAPLVETNTLAFCMGSDVDFSFGKLVLYNFQNGKKEVYPFYDINQFVKPVGGIYYEATNNSIYVLASGYGSSGQGGLMKFDLYSRSFSSLVDFGANPDFVSLVGYDPQITRVSQFPLGIHSPEMPNQELSLYPNPAAGQFYLDMNGTLNFSIYTASGTLVKRILNHDTSHPISTSDLAAGAYILRDIDSGKSGKLVVVK